MFLSTRHLLKVLFLGSLLVLRQSQSLPDLSVPSFLASFSPAVVHLIVIYRDSKKDVYGDYALVSHEGTGFFITDTGDILTDAHVVEGAESITVIVPDLNMSGIDERLEATVTGILPKEDLALLQLTPESLSYLQEKMGSITHLALDDSDKNSVNDTSIALGYPGGSADLKALSGIITTHCEEMNNSYMEFCSPVSTDFFGLGSSGGPIVNTEGRVMSIIQACGPARGQEEAYFLSGISSNMIKLLLLKMRGGHGDTSYSYA